MNEKELKKLREGATADIVAQLGDMPLGDVKALIAQEQAEKEPRQDLVNSANAYLVERLEADAVQANERAAAANSDAAEAMAKAEADAKRADEAEKKLEDAVESGEVKESPKEKRGEQMKEYLKPDYTGFLTGTQALERNEHLKKQAEKKSKK